MVGCAVANIQEQVMPEICQEPILQFSPLCFCVLGFFEYTNLANVSTVWDLIHNESET